MDVKNQHKEYEYHKTARQWALTGKLPKAGVEGVELWPNHNCCTCGRYFLYFAPDEVEPASTEQLEAFFADEKARKREYNHMRYMRDSRERRIERAKAKGLPVIPQKISDTIILDTETTGLYTYDNEILQLSIIDLDEDVLFDSYFKPEYHSSWRDAQRINGISPEKVQDAPRFIDKMHEITAIIQAAKTIIVYNAGFDLPFLSVSGIDFNKDTKVVDVMLDFAKVYGEWNDYYESYKWQKLTTAAAYYHYDWSKGGAHDALADCYATRHVYQKMQQDQNKYCL